MALICNFVQILNSGRLALSERPKIKEIRKLKPARCDIILTILSAKGEQAHKIGLEVMSCNMKWEWLKISNAGNMTNIEKEQFRDMVNRILEAVYEDQSVLVHCSAGLHRTGMFAYALLRKGGLDHEKTMKLIREIRPDTHDAMDEKYIRLADQLW